MNLFKLIFFPLFLGFWLFRLPWIVYLAIAGPLGYFAYLEFEEYRFNVFEAEFHVAAGVPDPTPLSKWDRLTDVTVNDELNVQGLYFTQLASGTFDPIGLEQGYILLADDQGREIKAAIVVDPSDLPSVERELASQGTGEAVAVTVNGLLIRNSDWSGTLGRTLDQANIPRADDFFLIEPIQGNREFFIYQRAEESIGAPLVLGALAGLLALYGVIRFLFSLFGSSKRSKVQAKNRARAEKQAKQPTRKALPTKKSAEASPWGTFAPIDGNASAPPLIPASQSPDVWPKPATQGTPVSPPAVPASETGIPLEPEFVSVFPGGGSGFQFKTADQIIRQTFGTLSSLTPPKRDD